jgi:hypothetical protein
MTISHRPSTASAADAVALIVKRVSNAIEKSAVSVFLMIFLIKVTKQYEK